VRLLDLQAAILYEDNHLLVVNKPAGIPVQGDKTGDEPLVEMLQRLRQKLEEKPGAAYVAPVHRLDRPVTGVCVFAKTSKAAGRLSDQFRNGIPHKKYLAWLMPRCDQPEKPLPAEGELFDQIKKKPGGTSLIVPADDRQGKPSHLIWRLLKQGNNRVFVEVELGTGRHHQIRVQFASRGWVVVGDKRYGSKRALPDRSIALHAAEITLNHPISGQSITIQAPPPASWTEWGPHTGRKL